MADDIVTDLCGPSSLFGEVGEVTGAPPSEDEPPDSDEDILVSTTPHTVTYD